MCGHRKRKRTREEREADDDREAVAALEAADFAKSEADGDAGGKEEEEEDYRTAAEKRFDEVKKQRVSCSKTLLPVLSSC